MGDERAPRRRPADRRVRARRPAVEGRPQAARGSHPRDARAVLPEVRSRSPRMASVRAARSTTSRAWPSRCRPASVPTVSNGLRVERAGLLDAARSHHRARRSPSAGGCPGSTRSAPSCCRRARCCSSPRSTCSTSTTLTISDWALREGIVLDAVVTHDPDDWSDDPRALRRASVVEPGPTLQLRRAPHRARDAPRAAACSTQTQSLHGLGRRRPRDARVRGAAARHRPARVTEGPSPARRVPRREPRSCAASRLARSRSSPRSYATIDAEIRSRPKPRFAALSDEDRLRLRKLAALLRVADGLDRGRRGVVEDLTADVGADLVILRLRAHGDAELALWGARRRRDLFEKVFGRELEFAVAADTERLKNVAPGKNYGSRRRSPDPKCRAGWAQRRAAIESDAPRTGARHAHPHPGSRCPPGPRTRSGRFQHGPARQGSRRRPRDRVRALPLEARRARRARARPRPGP